MSSLKTRIEERRKQNYDDLPITSTITNWEKLYSGVGDYYVIYGRIGKDSANRFKAGSPIRTSVVVDIHGDLAITLNSVYKLLDPA